MKYQVLTGAVALSILSTATLIQANPAQAYTLSGGVYTFNFSNKGSSDTVGDGVVSNFLLTLQQGSNPNQALFKFQNNTSAASGNLFIGQVAFNYKLNGTSPLSNFILNVGNVANNTLTPNNRRGVDFKVDNQPNLPQFWNNGEAEYAAVFNGGGQGVDRGEVLGLTATSSLSILALANLIDKHDLDVGIHVQGFGAGKSDAYTTVPTPALLPGLIGLGLSAIRKRRALQAAEAEG